jgi:hypothetical protein
VVAGGNSVQENHVSGAGGNITAGDVVYRQDADRKLHLADSDGASPEETRTPIGIALNGASTDQPVRVHRSGDITLGGATMTPGAAYYLSSNPGKICPFADVGAGEDVAQIGVAKSATVLMVDIQLPGITL